MKTLNDGTQVSSRSYYFLLDFNDQDSWETFSNLTSKTKLQELDMEEYMKLWEIATSVDPVTVSSDIVEKTFYNRDIITGTCTDPCPVKLGSPMIGSEACQNCMLNLGYNNEIRWVKCSDLNKSIARSTCFRCMERQSCIYAFDPYNKDGDCLANK